VWPRTRLPARQLTEAAASGSGGGESMLMTKTVALADSHRDPVGSIPPCVPPRGYQGWFSWTV
jgi:hypothetical protein